MSRTIKFRAWTGTEMVYNVVPWQWDYVIDRMSHRCIESNGPGILGSGGTRGMFEVPGIAFKEIMQFTGLLDKNGKEIFEGDVIQNVADDGSRLSIFEVIYDITRGGFCKDRIDTNDRYMLEPSKFYKVIGNIYQTPLETT